MDPQFGKSLILAALAATLLGSGQTAAQGWAHYGGDAGGRRYSPLAAINRDNVAGLEMAWSFSTGEATRRGDKSNFHTFQNTPILLPAEAGGSLVVCTPFSRIIALDPVTGTERWFFDPDVPLDNWMPYNCRGVSVWTNPALDTGAMCKSTIFMGTNDARVIAIDSRSGNRCTDFGSNGEVAIDVDRDLMIRGEIKITSPPVVVNGVVVVGSFIRDMLRTDAPSGKVRAYDARSGAPVWSFDPVPRDPADPAASTWHGDSAQTVGAANVWSVMSVDAERDLVFLPTTSPSTDYYGGHRPGENRYANSVVALRGATGEVAWHFQTVHHDVWDYDLPSQPVLIDLPVTGRSTPALVQPTKQGFLFVLHRETGEPLFPVEERPVPQQGVEGEWLSPTQPYPVAPPPLLKQQLLPEDAWGFTWFDRRACRKKIEALRSEGLYTPISLQGTVLMPSSLGGANWGSGAYDPQRNLFVINTSRVPGVVKLIPREEVANADT
ncbi:MAG: PQQ-binding-like beta-propeller repeat protein, partial [Acidiferrobacterales bacterium]|nr:PQQ-binding-like beta-propeller repeat protein [Acidiferrobacterales bacterium]